MFRMNESDRHIKLTEETLTAIDVEKLRGMFENLNTFATEMKETVQRVVEVIDEIARQNAPVVTEIIKNLNEIPRDFLVIQQALSERGWFVLAGMPLGDYRNLKKLIDASNSDDLDQTMGAWTLELLDETEKKLCDLFPEREALLREDFDNHRTGRYASAITLLLT